jgi:uncharacterized protein (DUF58 family)
MPMRSAYRKEFGLFALLFIPGVLLGNQLLAVLSLFPVVYIILSRLYRLPRKIDVIGEGRVLDLWSGDRIKIERKLVVKDGRGLLVLSLPSPTHAKIVSGPSIVVMWKGRGEKVVPLDRNIKLSRRGKYHLGSINITTIPAAEGEERTVANIGPEDRILVSDRLLDMRRLRESRLLNRLPMPTRSVGAIGAETADFKEIRKYGQGDRYRSINWKATARAGDGAIPLVNQYEMESRMAVLILLDNGPSMFNSSGGSTALEHGIHAVQSLSSLYLASDCEVGFYTFDGASTVYPRTGRRQGSLIGRKLLDIEVSPQQGGVSGAVRSFPDHLRSGALVIVITSLGQANVDEMENGLGQLRRHMGPRGRMALIDIVGDMPPAPADIAGPAVLLDGIRTSNHLRKVSVHRAMVDSWYPKEYTFSQFLLNRFGGRK